jgi:hypothetical protein
MYSIRQAMVLAYEESPKLGKPAGFITVLNAREARVRKAMMYQK